MHRRRRCLPNSDTTLGVKLRASRARFDPPAIVFNVPDLDVILAPALAPDDLLGLELHLLDAIGTRQTAPVLLIYASPGRAVSIGRYHLYGGPNERDGINVM